METTSVLECIDNIFFLKAGFPETNFVLNMKRILKFPPHCNLSWEIMKCTLTTWWDKLEGDRNHKRHTQGKINEILTCSVSLLDLEKLHKTWQLSRPNNRSHFKSKESDFSWLFIIFGSLLFTVELYHTKTTMRTKSNWASLLSNLCDPRFPLINLPYFLDWQKWLTLIQGMRQN